MKTINWVKLKKWRELLLTGRPEPAQQAERIVAMQRDVVSPSKVAMCLVVLGYLFYSGWREEPSTRQVVLETMEHYFEIYLLCILMGALFFIAWRRFPPELFQWLAFTLGLLDGLFMAGLIILTGGFDSMAFWIFPAFIVLNALSIPLATPQIVLNLLLGAFYATAVLLTPSLNPNVPYLAGNPKWVHRTAAAQGSNATIRATGPTAQGSNVTVRATHATNGVVPKPLFPPNPPVDTEDIPTEQLVLRVSVLWLLTLCCYGAQVLSERQRRAIQEAAEFAAREGQLHAAGRLAAEFTHRMKNPLAIINTAAYSLQRSLRENRNSAAQQFEIIQEEVARADKVITQIMGYAQLSEGRVEKLQVVEELEKAIAQVFPPAVPSDIALKRNFVRPFPPLLMQRGHLSEILANLLQNAREALNGRGEVSITATTDSENSVELTIADNGPGVPPDKIERIFEAYFTTKEKGTGLGLAIVKHNIELYGGTVRVESVLGQGTKFTVRFPAKSLPKPFAK